MSSSSRLLPSPALGSTPRALDAPAPALDEFVRARVSEARAAAFDEGRRHGAEQARQDLGAALERIESAFASVRSDLRALQQARAGAAVDLAEVMATAVLGRVPHDGGEVLLGRLREALGRLDDAPLTVRVHPTDAELVTAAVARAGEVAVTADPALPAGEAVVEGAWARADLTRAAAWDAIRDLLEGAERG